MAFVFSGKYAAGVEVNARAFYETLSHDTSEFACDSFRWFWKGIGQQRHPRPEIPEQDPSRPTNDRRFPRSLSTSHFASVNIEKASIFCVFWFRSVSRLSRFSAASAVRELDDLLF
jgi:hypothetical protein